MELITQHIHTCLKRLEIENVAHLSSVFNKIQSEYKNKYAPFLRYIDIILNNAFLKNNKEIKILHLNFENDCSDSISSLIGEYLIIRYFNCYKLIDTSSVEINSKLIHLKQSLEEKQKKLSVCPDGASGKNGGNKVFKNWISHKNDIKSLLEFYGEFNETNAVSSKILFNCQVKINNSLQEFFRISPFAINIDKNDYLQSYCLLNSNKTLNDIDEFNNEIIDELESIVLFDCERKSIMVNFSFEEINKWNIEYGTNFKKYLIITFGKKPHSINSISNKIETIRERFKIPVNTTYTVLSSEIDFLLNKKEKSSSSIEFVGLETSSFWDEFLTETSVLDLYELRSIKLMNVYSICLTDEIKSYILNDLFSKEDLSELLSSRNNTKQAILELRDEDIDKLKEALSNTLDLIINSGIKSRFKQQLNNSTIIILDEAIIRNAKLVSKFTKALDLTRSIKLKPWSELTNPVSKFFLILSYRDQGKYPNYYYPNLLENEYQPETIANAILPNFLFGHHYKWSKYYLLKEYHKYLNHPIRENHFEWTKIGKIIQSQKPESKLKIDWALENEYSNLDQRDSYKIKVQGQKAKTAYSSDLFIISVGEKDIFKVVKIDSLLNADDETLYIQNLDEIQESINIYEKIIDKKQQEAELDVIRKQFNLGNENAGRLWKILLKNIADLDGEAKLYNNLKIYFESKGLKIVSQFHFKNSWINTQSESLAPLSKRIFIELCAYLKIPKIYFVIIQRIRNASKQSSRQSTRQMNQLLKDLFNDGCFDNGKSAREIINNKLSFYKSNHPLDELGIDESYLADNLVTLTELIQPELKLLELETVEKIKQ